MGADGLVSFSAKNINYEILIVGVSEWVAVAAQRCVTSDIVFRSCGGTMI